MGVRNSELKKTEEFIKAMQGSWSEFLSHQLQQQEELCAELRTHQTQHIQLRSETEKACENIQALVTGLSSQVVQLTSQLASRENSFSHGGIQNNSQGGNSLHFSFSRFSKVEFPKFSGDDVLGWVYKCELFFEIDNTNEGANVKIASIHLDGNPLAWHQSYMRSRPPGNWPTWSTYKQAISSRFGQTPFDDPTRLKQTSTVEQY